jgi:hypothetical protein
VDLPCVVRPILVAFTPGTERGEGSRHRATKLLGSYAGAVAGPEELFAGFPDSLAICTRVASVVAEIGDATVAVSKSQVAFKRRRGFAYVWRPGQYVSSHVPAVLSIALPHEVTSGRWKEVVHPSPRVWMHHLELRTPADVDDEVRGWLREAYAETG